ncbi:MAG: RNA methyltransferase [Saprospirales bacterium]|nr:RNA methyltransferase [Saprospirales bacterium]MBK8922923.1 RNA methyltransferase [Saprospirales bacterium]
MKKLSMKELQRFSVPEFRGMQKLPLALVLENVRSGLNVGSVFRTADAFAVERIFLCGITAQPPHREILKTALGSTETVDWIYRADALETIRQLRSEGFRIYGVEQTTEKTWLQDLQADPSEKYALVFGNEVNGVAIDTLMACDGVLEIPQFGTKHSLNIAVAAGIAVWEFVRQLRL